MTRDAVVKFSDGTEHVYEALPEGVTPAQVTERASQEFGKSVVSTEAASAGGGVPTVRGRLVDATPTAAPDLASSKAAYDAVQREYDSFRKAPAPADGLFTQTPERRAYSAKQDDFYKRIRAAKAELDAAGEGAKAVDEGKLRQAAVANPVEFSKKGFGGIIPNLKHFGNIALGAAGRGVAGLPALLAAGGQATDPGRFTKTPEDVFASLNSVGAKPVTKGEKYLGSGVEAATGAFFGPGSAAQKLITGAASGLGGEGAAQTFDDNAITRIIGALVGGGASALGFAKAPTATKILRDGVSELTPADIAKGLELEKTLRDNNIKYSGTQLFGDKSTLPDIFKRVSSNEFVRPKVLGNLSGSPESATDAVKLWQAGNLPPTGATSRQAVADVQGAAADRLKDLGQQGNVKYTQKLAPGTSASTYTPGEVKDIITALRAKSLDPEFHGPASGGGKFLAGAADDLEILLKESVILGPTGKPLQVPVPKGFVNNYIKTLNTKAFKEGYAGRGLADAEDIIRAGTPEFQAARNAKADFIKGTTNPVKKGLTGQLANMGGGVKQDKYTANAQAITNTISKTRGQAQEIAELSKQIGPDNVTALFQEHLTSARNAALTPTTSLATEVQQPYFIQANSRGAPGSALRENVDASLRAAAKSYGIPAAQLQGSFHKLMDALESFKHLKIAGGVDAASIDGVAGANAASKATAPFAEFRRYFQDVARARTYKKIAEIALDPEGAKLLVAIATSKKPDTINALIRGVIQQSQATDVPQEQP